MDGSVVQYGFLTDSAVKNPYRYAYNANSKAPWMTVLHLNLKLKD
jgi:hypothetical protein